MEYFAIVFFAFAFGAALFFWVRMRLRETCDYCKFPIHRCECPDEIAEQEAIQRDTNVVEIKRRKLRQDG